MPTNIRIVHAHEFIIATPEGQIDLEESKKLLVEFASISQPPVDYEVLMDVRKTQLELSIADLWYLAAELGNFREALPRRTAVLCPLEQFDYAGFFALCAQNRGFQISAFTSFEAAIEWLIEGEFAAGSGSLRVRS
ncbi:MAG TPA: hypothetical protein VMP08_03085 [Anaerolineae bacterium]|nr:hypothetical protein [Anaerolineae bacterium]